MLQRLLLFIEIFTFIPVSDKLARIEKEESADFSLFRP